GASVRQRDCPINPKANISCRARRDGSIFGFCFSLECGVLAPLLFFFGLRCFSAALRRKKTKTKAVPKHRTPKSPWRKKNGFAKIALLEPHRLRDARTARRCFLSFRKKGTNTMEPTDKSGKEPEPTGSAARPPHFIEQIVEEDIRTGKFGGRVQTRF